jgi:hypothetical protein
MNMENTMKQNTKATQNTLETKSVEKSTLGNVGSDSQMRIEDVRNSFGRESKCPLCGGEVKQDDFFVYSRTVGCIQCDHRALIISSPTIRMIIQLVNFHTERGVGLNQRPLDDLSIAEELIDCLRTNRLPSIEAIVDFGIDSSCHFRALRMAHWVGCNAYDFDRVLGDGRAITQLIQATPNQCCPDIRFFTVSDWGRSRHSQTDWVEEDD